MSVISEFEDYLFSKNYSKRTVESYTACLKKYLAHFKDHPKNISTKQIYSFLAGIEQVNTKKQYVGMLRQLYSGVCPQKNKVGKIIYPKKEKHLPIILTPEEIRSAIKTIDNVKHRAIIQLSWVCALRISEILNLKVKHISRDNQIFIQNSKGAKDRVIPVPEDTLNLIRLYYKRFLHGKVVSPDDYLFSGSSKPYSATSIRNILDRAIKKAGIIKSVKFHSLRHSRASYWIQMGLSTKEVAELLGHNSVKTTEIYTHVSNHQLKSKLLALEEY